MALVGRTVADVERDLILDTLQHTLGNRTHAATILGISIRTLRNKLRQYGAEGVPVPRPSGAPGRPRRRSRLRHGARPMAHNLSLAPAELLGRAGHALRQGDLALALGVIAILVVLILPMPRLLLDLLLALSITFSVLVLLTSLFIERPLEFSSFPAVLLIATMLRLALNLASTRLILADGHEGSAAAGRVIEAFGGFVMQGNFVIGLIVFAILVIVNFVVITKGSGRIAEVSARFSLDAMPGKQMAIDADLSAGLIDEQEAKHAARASWRRRAAFSAPWTAPRSSSVATPSPGS